MKIKKVHVYRNLHKKCWSIRCNGKVISHQKKVLLRDVTFHVQPAGMARVRETGKKNVHAYVKGFLSSIQEIRNLEIELGLEKNDHFEYGVVTYNPYKFDSFVKTSDNSPIYFCDFLDMDIESKEMLVYIDTKKILTPH